MSPEVRALLQQAVGLHRAGQLTEAAALYDRALGMEPTNADALNLKAVVREAQGRREDALALFDRALAARARFPEAHFNRANTLAALDRADEALAAYTQAISLRADYADAHLNAALFLRSLDRRDEAHAAFERMAAACPLDARAPYGIGNEEAHRGAFTAAIACMRAALKLRPDWPQALNDLGSYLVATDAVDDAIAAFDRAAVAAPDDLTPRINIGLTRLARGELGPGWDGYAHRNADPQNPYRPTPVDWPWPQWQGEDLHGKTIFLWNDQGIGDAILYAGMVPEIAALAQNCIIGCDPRLRPILQRSFPAVRVVAYLPGQPPPDIGPCDLHSTLLDVGRWRRRAFSDFPNRRGYLVPDRRRAAVFREGLRAQAGATTLLAGLSWRSANPLYGAAKSLQLADFTPHLQEPGAQFFDIQYGDTAEEIARLPRQARIHATPDLDRFQDLDALADYIAALDVVITVSNTTAHLAAALGVPTWILVPAARARLWYWFRRGTTSPWYASARVYRVPETGWSAPLAQSHGALIDLARGAARLGQAD